MKKKYYNEAVIGNDKIVASFSSKGEMLRLFYPSPDCRQFIDEMYTGVKVNDSMIIYLHDDINNQYDQYYTENTNVLNTQIKNTYFNLSILQTDFTPIQKNVLIKKYVFTNENSIDLNVNFLIYSKLLSSFNNMVGTVVRNDIFMQYSHNYTYSIFSKTPILSYKLNGSKEEIKYGTLQDKDYIGMSNDSAVSFDIGHLKPGESKELEIFIYINSNREKFRFDEIVKDIDELRNIDVNREQKKVEKYWQNFVKEHDELKILSDKKKWEKLITGENQTNGYTYKKYLEMKNIYTRSILLFPLLSNAETGGISAALEVDEETDKCGRYAYCWPRDAVFITKALDILNMKEQTTRFYTRFCKQTQSENGMWEQRFYTDGRLAPCWGYQIDETASVVYGVYEHYKVIQDKQFLQNTYHMCKKAIDAIETFLFDLSVPFASHINMNKIEKFERYQSYDLWEMNEGVHLYSLSAIYAAYKAMIQIEKELKPKANIDNLEKNAQTIKEYCLNNFINKEDSTLKRSNKDNICDISLLGTVIPFDMLNKNQKEVTNTIEKINLNLKTYTGGYIRFEKDSYLGGNNPWPIATLWMALYNLKVQNKQDALKQIQFAIDTATKHGFLSEQVDNEKMQAKWVIGLGWSHAMYIIALKELAH